MPKGKKPSSSERRQLTGTFTSHDVTRITGVSLRQLQWWDEQGVVSPMQRSHRRLYQLDEVVEVSLITQLRRKGISLQKIRRVLKFLKKELGKGLYESVQNGHEVHLLTDGKNIYLEDDRRRIVDILNDANQPMISVCVSDQIKRLSAPGLKKGVKSDTRPTPARSARAS